jgi:hypothetical protein
LDGILEELGNILNIPDILDFTKIILKPRNC